MRFALLLRALRAMLPLATAILCATWGADPTRADDRAEIRSAVTALGSTSPAEREAAVAVLREQLRQDAGAAVPAILEVLLEIERPHTAAARRLIVDHGEGAIEPLLRCAADRRTRVAGAAEAALGEIGAPVIPKALALLRRGTRQDAGLGARGLKAVGKPALPVALAELDAARDPEARQMIAWALGSLGRGAPEAVPPLARLLEDEEGSTSLRAQAARSLGLVGAAATATAIAALERAAISGGGTTLQARAAWALGEIGGPTAFDALLHAVTATAEERGRLERLYPEVRDAVAEAFARLGSEAHARLAMLSRASDPEVQVIAFESLARLGSRRSQAVDLALRDGLRSDLPAARDAAERGLTSGDARSTRLVLELLRDPSVVMRRRAAALLGRWEGIEHAAGPAPNSAHLARWGGFDAIARPALSMALDDDDALVRFHAARALSGMGPSVRAALAARLSNPGASPRARAGAARALGSHKVAPAPPLIARALSDACAPDEPAEVREAAAGALRAWRLDPPAGAPAAPLLEDGDRALLSWFDGLGFPSFSGRKLVEVRTGGWSQRGGGSPQADTELAILLEETDEYFRVLGLDLAEARHARDEKAEWPVRFEVLDLERTAHEVVEARRAAQEAKEQAERDLKAGKVDPARLSALHDRFGERISQRAELFVTARLCEANGVTAAARALLDDVRVLSAPAGRQEGRRSEGAPPRALDVQEQLETDIGHAEMWRSVVAFGDPDTSRRTLLERFRAFPERFPSSEHVQRARETAALLGPMVSEDVARAARGPLPEDAPVEARVADLILELRDQNGHQLSQPGSCDIFTDRRGDASPAHRLVAIGMPAVPQLIEVVDDRRPTRSVGYHRDFYFSHYVLTIGDCAIAIIQQIAQRPFYERRSTSGAAVKDGQASAIKVEMRRWWATLQAKGEEGFLREAVASGDDRSPYEAVKLVERYGASALGPIAEGTRKAEPRTRAALVAIASELEGPTATAFLAEELEAAPHLTARVAAARGLHARGDSRAVAAMIQAWRAPPRPPAPARRGDDLEEMNRRDFDDNAIHGVLAFLAAARDPEAIRALGEGLEARPLGMRAAVIESFDPATWFGARFHVRRGGGGPFDAPSVTTGGAEEAIEALLVASLEDEAVRAGTSGTRGGESYRDPRICDLAASALCGRYPERYGFHLGGTMARKDREIALARNTWRKARGLAPLPVPEVPAPPFVDDAVVAEAVKAASDARDDVARAAALARLETLGPGAARAIDAQAQLLPPDAPVRRELLALARRLAFRVREVRVSSSTGVEPTRAVVDILRPLEGRALPAGAIADALLAFARAGEPEGRTLSITAERPGDLTGVAIRVVFSQDAPRGGMTGWGCSCSVEVAGEHIGGSGGSRSAEYSREPKAYADLAEALEKASGAGPAESVSVRASLTCGRK